MHQAFEQGWKRLAKLLKECSPHSTGAARIPNVRRNISPGFRMGLGVWWSISSAPQNAESSPGRKRGFAASFSPWAFPRMFGSLRPDYSIVLCVRKR